MRAGVRSSRKIGRLRRLGLAVVAVLALTGLAGCFPQGGGGGAPPITYQVFIGGGASSGLVLYDVPGGTQTENIGPVFSKDVGYTEFAGIVASHDSFTGGTIECVLIRNGVVLVHNVSSGPIALVSCFHSDF